MERMSGGKTLAIPSDFAMKGMQTSDATLQETAACMRKVQAAIGLNKFEWQRHFSTGESFRWALKPKASPLLFEANRDHKAGHVAMLVDTYLQHELRWLSAADLGKIQASLGDQVAKGVTELLKIEHGIPCLIYIGKEGVADQVHIASAWLPRIPMQDVVDRPQVDQEVLFMARFWNSMTLA